MTTAILILMIVVGTIVAVLVAGRWLRGAMTPKVGNLGTIQRWRATGGPEDVLLRRLAVASKSVDAAVIDSFDAPELRWQLDQAEQLIVAQLVASAQAPKSARPAIRREVEEGVRRYEKLSAQLVLSAAAASSAVVHDRLDAIELSVNARAAARAELDSLAGPLSPQAKQRGLTGQ